MPMSQMLEERIARTCIEKKIKIRANLPLKIVIKKATLQIFIPSLVIRKTNNSQNNFHNSD